MNTGKRILTSVLCILVMLICVIGISSCNNKKDDCKHSWGEWGVKTDATCTKDGVKEAVCLLCGETKEEKIDALGHSGKAYCGTRARCERCNVIFGEAAEHQWIDATCTAPKTCSVCSATEGEALGHKGGNATCTIAEYCTVCGEVFGSVLEHSGGTASCKDKAICELCGVKYGDLASHKWLNATCTAPKTCSICSATEGEALGHKGGTASCTELAKCTTCGDTYGELAAHNWSEATCAKLSTCEACGQTRGDVASHKWEEATCTAPKTCSVCYETEGEAAGHNYEQTDVAPTCTQKGYTTHTCSACGDTYNDTETDALGHSWSDPTCAHERTCSECDATEPALKHNYELSSSQSATCTTPKIDTYTCPLCSDSYTDEDGSELGHNISGVIPTEVKVEGAKCDYIQVYVCNTCGHDVEGDRVSHHEYIAKVTTEATCVADGEKTLTCADCGHITKQTIKKNTNSHIWNSGNLSGNIRTYTCTNTGCGQTKTAVDASAEESAKVNASDLAAAGGVDLKGASMALDQTTLGAVANKDLTLSAGTLEGAELDAAKAQLTTEQLGQLGNNPIYNFTMNDGTQNITSFGGGYITITIPYKVPDGEDVDSVAIWYISEGAPVCIEASYSNGYVTFQTNHFSYYSVTRLTPEERCDLYGHNVRETVVEATCIKDGYTLEICIRCAKSEKKDIVAATGHNYTSVETPATCTVAGKIVYTCGCGHSYKTTLAATGHNWEIAETVEPTCTAEGYIKHVCDNCGEDYKQTRPQIKHTYKDTVVPATCEVNGYTYHKCSVCGHEYKDRMTPAFGHQYRADWTWRVDHADAILVFVCQHSLDHTVQVTANITTEKTDATCALTGIIKYTAQVVYKGVLYTDEVTQIIPKAPHTPVDEWKSSESSHWHICEECQAKVETEAHSFGAEEIIKKATCSEEGESRYTCSVCKYVKTKTTPTVAHSYKNEVCENCGHFAGDCDHSRSNATVSIDLSAHGACGGIFVANTCACGSTIYISDMESFGQKCMLSFGNPEQGLTQDGDMYMKTSAHCKACGFNVDVYAVAKVSGCFLRAVYEYKFSVNGETFLDNVIYVQEMDYHDTEYELITVKNDVCGDITAYGEVCKTCGIVEYLGGMQNSCNITYEDGEYTDEDGNVREYERGVCSRCGYVFYEEEWYEIDGCYEIEYETKCIEFNGERIFEFERNYKYDNHEYEYEYSLVGKSCEDGVTIKGTCSVCGFTQNYSTSYHEKIPTQKHDLSKFGGCGGYVQIYSCACGKRGRVEINYKCANVAHNMMGMSCSDCGLAVIMSTRSESEGCYNYIYSTYNIRIGSTEILSNYTVLSEVSEDHNYNYSFTLYGESCADGYVVSATCCECGNTYTKEHTGEGDYHNMYRTAYYDLTEYGICGGYVSVYRCACGYENRFENNFCCYDEGYDDSYEYTDDNGVLHTVESWNCRICGFERTRDSYSVRNGCVEEIYNIWTLKIADSVIVSDLEAKNGTREYHDYEYSFALRRESCNDGYTVNAVCRKCGYSYEGERYYHETYKLKEYNFMDYGACSGYITIWGCACGQEGYYSFGEGYNFTYVDSLYYEYTDNDGVLHCVESGVCSDCGLEVMIDTYTKKEGCDYYRYKEYTVKMNGEAVISELLVCDGRWESHNYEYSFELSGSSCDDGYNVSATCRSCGDSVNSREYGHREYLIEKYDLLDYGTCGGYIHIYACPCGEAGYIDRGMDCNYEQTSTTYTDNNGISHTVQMRTCQDCGLELRTDTCNSKNGCKTYTYVTISLAINGETVMTKKDILSDYQTSHDYAYTYDMNGESCEDGYRVYAVCKDCGNSYDKTDRYHNILCVENYDLTSLGACGGYASIYSCACGQEKSFKYKLECSYSTKYDDYTDDNGIYHEISIITCDSCGVCITRDGYTDKEGCLKVSYYGYTVKVGEQTIISEYKYKYTSWYDHLYEHTFMLNGTDCEEGFYVAGTCYVCGHTTEEEGSDHELYRTQHIDLAEQGICGGYVDLYSCACGKNKSLKGQTHCDADDNTEIYIDNNGFEYAVTTRACGHCGMVLILEAYTEKDGCDLGKVYSYNIKVEDRSVLDDYICAGERWQEHDYELSFDMNGSSCKDGYSVISTCSRCGHQEEDTGYYDHCIFSSAYYDFADYGACHGSLEITSCPCGLVKEYSYSSCSNSYNSNKYYDDYGRLVCVELETCDTCGLRIQSSYYDVRDASSCTTTRYSTIVFSTNTSAIEPIEITKTETAHDYVASGRLDNGAKTCDDGVTIIYTCQDCGDSYDNHYTHHYDYLADIIDLAPYGSTCGGYAELYGCACGFSKDISMERILCEFDRNYVSCDIPGAIKNGIYTVTGWNSFSSFSNIYTCSVTDPHQCTFKIRESYYWLKVDGKCQAQAYKTWQIGYNEETGECEYVITYKLGNPCTYHDYEFTETFTDTKTERLYVCKDCSSKYSDTWYSNSNGETIKYEAIAINNINDGYAKSKIHVEEYAYRNEGRDKYTSRSYTETVKADGTISWEEYTTRVEAYTASFGYDGYKIIMTNRTSSGGETIQTNAYTYCKGYLYPVYQYISNVAYGTWENCDYSYDFTESCTRTTRYTDSDGKDETYTESYHKGIYSNTLAYSTCTQDGAYEEICSVCETVTYEGTWWHNGHYWVSSDDGYYCSECGLENANGADGDIIFEDFSANYGGGENYVVGYYCGSEVEFIYTVSIILYTPLSDGQDEIILDDVTFADHDTLRAVVFSKSEVEDLAALKGYNPDEYDVRFAFVPVGADGSLDYAITFTE